MSTPCARDKIVIAAESEMERVKGISHIIFVGFRDSFTTKNHKVGAERNPSGRRSFLTPGYICNYVMLSKSKKARFIQSHHLFGIPLLVIRWFESFQPSEGPETRSFRMR
jgi:hypothetical protein